MILIRPRSSLLLGRLAAKSKNSALFCSTDRLIPRYRLTSNIADPSPDTPYIVKYLIDSAGLSLSEATKASKLISHIKSPAKPDSVIDFLRQNGFNDANIRRIILIHSRLLCAKVDSTLKPKLEVLRKLGFSEIQIIKLVTANPLSLHYLTYCNLRPRIEFLRVFLCSNDDIVKAFTNDISLLSCGLENKIKPNISFLMECQIPNEKIGLIMTKDQKIIGRSLESLKSIVQRTVELGFPCGTRMFFHAFCCLSRINSDGVDAKIKLMTSLGFSKPELFSAILKQPAILNLSEKNLSETVDFLVKEIGCDISYVSNRPSIVCHSLTKRLIPRNYVLQLIQEKGFSKKKLDFYYVVKISEKKFLEKFIFSFREKMPELHYVYLSASAGKFFN